MTWMTKGLIVGTFVVGFSVGWLANNDEAAVSAQGQAPVMMKRIYTGEDGLSHVEEIELNAESVLENVTGAVVRVFATGIVCRLARRSDATLHYQSYRWWPAGS